MPALVVWISTGAERRFPPCRRIVFLTADVPTVQASVSIDQGTLTDEAVRNPEVRQLVIECWPPMFDRRPVLIADDDAEMRELIAESPPVGGSTSCKRRTAWRRCCV